MKESAPVQKSEHGAIIVLVALLIFVVVGIIAIVVDLSIASSSAEQARHIARVLALGSIEEYYKHVNETDTCVGGGATRHEESMCFAQQRAQGLADRFELFSQNVNGSRLDPPQVSLTDSDQSVLLSAGNWYTAAHPLCDGEPNPDDNCPCDELPCFLTLEDARTAEGNPDLRPNAMRANGTFFPALTMRLAKNLFGVESIALHATAVSSIVPRRGCFLIDVSPSVTFETHRRLDIGIPRDADGDGSFSTPCDCEPGTCLCDSGPDPAEAFGNKYAYLLTDENDAFSAYDQRQDCGWYWLNNVRTNHTSGTPPLFPTDPPGLAELCGSFDDPDDVPDGGPISLLDLYPIDLYSPFDSGIIDRNGAPYEPTKHFRDDYKRFFSFGDGDYSTGNVDDQMNITQHFPDPANFGDRYLAGFDGQWVNADVYEDGDPGTQLGPEPLRTIMAGLRTAMTEFKDRQIAGDQACVVFFDRNTPWFRVLRMTSDFDFLEEFTDFTIPENSPYNSDPNFDPIDFSSIRSTLNTDGIGDRRLRLIRHGVFPFRGSSSDFRVGIGEGLFQLAQARQDGVSTSEFLVMITDGLHNCLGNPTLCGFTYNYYRQAMDELKTEYLNPNLAGENRTPLHIVVTGSHVGPHTVELEEVAGSSPPDGNFIGGAGSQVNCFTDEEYREATPTDPVGLDFVKGTDDPEFAFDNMFEHPFYDANKDLYEIAVVTQGVFGALRPRNDNFCDSVIDPNGNHVGHEGFSPSEYRPLCGEQVETADDGTPDPEVINDVDSDGRRLTDPYCRNEQAQIESLMKEIIGQNPFNIVLMK